MKNEQGQNTDVWFVICSRNTNTSHLGNLTTNNKITKGPMIEVSYSGVQVGRFFK